MIGNFFPTSNQFKIENSIILIISDMDVITYTKYLRLHVEMQFAFKLKRIEKAS